MASYVFVRYYGGDKQRKYVRHVNGNWYYSERSMKFRFGHRHGWTYWTKWQKETGPVKLIDNETISTPIGDAYRTDEIVFRITTDERRNRIDDHEHS